MMVIIWYTPEIRSFPRTTPWGTFTKSNCNSKWLPMAANCHGSAGLATVASAAPDLFCTTNRMPSLSFVIPMHNEAGNCAALIEEIAATAASRWDDYEIICVDDASTDNTLALLQALRQRIPRLEIIAFAANCGQSTALCAGVRAARGELIATLDGDGQNDPADVPAMVDLLLQKKEDNVQMIAGWRKKRQDTSWRHLCSRVANTVRSFLLRDNTPDTGCGLKVFYRQTFMELPWFDHMHRFLPSLVQRGGGRVISMEVRHRPRRHGASHYGTMDRLRVGIVDLLGVAWLQRRYRVPVLRELPGAGR